MVRGYHAASMAADLVCLGCRTVTAERVDLRTLERRGEVYACECGRRYPIVDGVPLIFEPALDQLIEPDLDPEVAALLVAPGPDGAPYPHLLDHLSIYLASQWGDGLAAVIEKLAPLPVVDRAVELGCSVGRIVAELARRAGHVIGLDVQLAAVRRARRILTGEPLAYARRIVGRHYEPARIAIAPVVNATLICADALDPPLVPRTFDRVVAINVLDSVRSPRQLLDVMDALCVPGGELILTSPYVWQSSVMAEDERIGGADPAAAVASHLRETGYMIEDEADLPWTLRRDARCSLSYRTHYLRARKP
jgi:SAM-dependent methyltransferase